jgi:hypothetical protein
MQNRIIRVLSSDFCILCGLYLLSQDRSLAPAYDLQRRKAKLVNHSEALLSLLQDFLAGVLLEAKQNFEEGCGR